MNRKALLKCMAFISAVIMTGCSAANTPVETVENTLSAEVTTVSETSEETTTEQTSAETTAEETTLASTAKETTTAEETTAETESEAPSDMEIKFFDYKLIEDYPASEIPEDMQEKAVDFLKSSDYYTEAMAHVAEYEADADLAKYIEIGKIKPQFFKGWREDFDGDGIEEAFLVINMPDSISSFPMERSFVIFSDKNGELEILDNTAGLYPATLIDYGEFKHIGIGGSGSCGAEDHIFLYGVSDGKVKELYGMRGGFSKFGCFLNTYGWQCTGSTMYFDTEKQQYISITGEPVSLEEFRALDTENITADFFPENEEYIPPVPALRFGSKYYVVIQGIMDIGTVFVYEDGKLSAASGIALRSNSDCYNDSEHSVENIDIDAALENMKKVD